jgi:hypothetical protein
MPVLQTWIGSGLISKLQYDENISVSVTGSIGVYQFTKA